MDQLFYFAGRAFVALIQMLPLRSVAWIGRFCGGLAYWLDVPHRKVAVANMVAAFPEKTQGEIRALARENFRRIGENYLSAVRTARMSFEQLRPYLELPQDLEAVTKVMTGRKCNAICAIGHFGNFELYARLGQDVPGLRRATTYRSLPQRGLNRVLLLLREKSGCLFFERRTESEQLRAAMNEPNLLLGLLSDQHAGRSGVWLPFLGRECSTTAAPALFALRYECALFTAVCYRTGLARWRIEVGPEIPTHDVGKARSTEAIMADVNRALEAAVRRDPANWFWVHNRWKPPKRGPRKIRAAVFAAERAANKK